LKQGVWPLLDVTVIQSDLTW